MIGADDRLYKALRDLEPDEQTAALLVIRVLARTKNSGQVIEVRPLRHQGWQVLTVHREVVQPTP